jgi:hypothetical protein
VKILFLFLCQLTLVTMLNHTELQNHCGNQLQAQRVQSYQQQQLEFCRDQQNQHYLQQQLMMLQHHQVHPYKPSNTFIDPQVQSLFLLPSQTNQPVPTHIPSPHNTMLMLKNIYKPYYSEANMSNGYSYDMVGTTVNFNNGITLTTSVKDDNINNTQDCLNDEETLLESKTDSSKCFNGTNDKKVVSKHNKGIDLELLNGFSGTENTKNNLSLFNNANIEELMKLQVTPNTINRQNAMNVATAPFERNFAPPSYPTSEVNNGVITYANIYNNRPNCHGAFDTASMGKLFSFLSKY